MRIFEDERNARSGVSLLGKAGAPVAMFFLVATVLHAQSSNQANLAQQVAQLTDALARTQGQLERSLRDLDEMRQKLTELQRELVANGISAPASSAAPESESPAATPHGSTPDSTAASIEDLRERVSMQGSEIATQEQTKVESESKYPVKISGMLLMTGFKNTNAVDTPATPTIAVGGQGNAGATVRQTILGFEARGPHLFGANSDADLRVDFYGSQTPNAPTSTYSGYFNTNPAFLRLRTAHAVLDWSRTQLYFALDRPIISPDTPSSLIATAIPAFAWSGNLWTWNPQIGVTRNFSSPGSSGIQLQAALIDTNDAPLTPPIAPASSVVYVPPTSAQQSSKPGVEARVALVGPGTDDRRMHIGIGGHFARHDSSLGKNYDSWASTIDVKLPLVAHLELSGSSYRGAALGGLGAGGYKDFVYSPNPYTGGYYFQPLDDAGGWAQLKERATERLQFNAGYGMDNVFAEQLRRYYVEDGSIIQNLARNRTYAANVIYSPSAYLLFSFEYRRIDSIPVEDTGAATNVIGVGAGYRF